MTDRLFPIFEDHRRVGLTVVLAFCWLTGCSSVFPTKVEPLLDPESLRPSPQVWQLSDPLDPSKPATQPMATRPAGLAATRPAAGPSTRPATGELPSPPYRINADSIPRLVYHKYPLVTSAREQMIAAQHGLQEFKANLSRFEPFTNVSGMAFQYPERRDASGLSGEVTGGIEKETFDGAIYRVEGGARGERIKYGEVGEGQASEDSGEGGLVRGRVEVPFIGSRKRQDRTINQAYQESTARAAVLNYLSYYRSYALTAMNYYAGALLYLGYARAYEHQIEALEDLLKEPGLTPQDQQVILTSIGSSRIVRDSYKASYQSYLLWTLEYLGIRPGEEYYLEEPPVSEGSIYYDRTRTDEQRQELLTEAYESNPRFRVLNDAIRDAELKRSQAILGKNDITAFVEGTQHAFGAETFDDRVGGWELRGGVSFRMNDPRVLNASIRKAEAEIRSYQAQIEAEELSVQQQIAVQSATLTTYVESKPQILKNIDEARSEFEARRKAYFAGQSTLLRIDDVLSSLQSITTAEVRLVSNRYYTALADNMLMSASGQLYQMAGVKLTEDAGTVGLAEKK
ncbi:MAG TPA: TolC family protein [Phycisphaerae bacterium]|nr:TolC family protein [Phycisphaerae bacterium]HRR84823.1 TolC family protein [Phycisphaerae bacterium]